MSLTAMNIANVGPGPVGPRSGPAKVAVAIVPGDRFERTARPAAGSHDRAPGMGDAKLYLRAYAMAAMFPVVISASLVQSGMDQLVEASKNAWRRATTPDPIDDYARLPRRTP